MITHEELGAACYAVGAAGGWWLACHYDYTNTRWLTVIAACAYTIPAALRVLGLFLWAPA